MIFRRYAELGSVSLLRAELDRLGIVSKRREGAGGRLAGGQHFSRGALYLMLQNRTYRGDIVHQGTAYPGQHKAILDPELCQIVQDKLTANRRERSLAVGAEAPSAGLVELIKEAFAIRNQFLSGSHDSIEAMSGRLGMNKGRLTSLVRLSYLGPEIVRALLAGSQSNALTPSRLLRLSKNLPHDWKEQRCFLGFAA